MKQRAKYIFQIRLFKSLLFITLLWAGCCVKSSKPDYYALLKEMFAEMVVKKDASLIPKYYDSDFILYTNGSTQSYKEFLQFHEKVYKTPIQYAFTFNDETVLTGQDGLSASLSIKISKPGEPTRDLELILIAKYKGNKIYRIWELTYPDWSNMPSFSKT